MTKPEEPALSRQERLRRVIILCCAVLRNFSYYRAGWDGENRFFTGELQATVNSNFLDMGVIDWCKLFGENRENHHWSQIFEDVNRRRLFKKSLHDGLNCNRAQWKELRDGMLAYRHRFLAHLDEQREMQIPKLELAINAAIFYHHFLMSQENDGRTYGTLPDNGHAYNECCHAEGLKFYCR